MRLRHGWLNLGLTLALAGCADGGGQLPEDVAQEAIVGGQPDTTSHAVIGIITREGELCSGSLILPNLVLTARHCVAALASDSVQCGVSMFGAVHPASDFAISWDANLRDNIDDSTVYRASSVRVPPDPGVCGNDIALIELSTNVPADQAVPIVPRIDSPPATNEVFNAVGYGITNPNDQSGSTAGQRMRYDGGKVTCVGTACRGGGSTANEWTGQVPVCSGDSGGPALDSQGRVIGATSRGPQDCASAVYSAVSPWKSFILDGATDATSDGGYDPPGWVTGEPTSDGGMANGGGTSMPGAGRAGGGGRASSGGASGSGGARAGGGGAPGTAGASSSSGGMSSVGSGGRRGQGAGGFSGSAGTAMSMGGVPAFSGAGGRASSAGTSSGAGAPAAAAGMHSSGGAGGSGGQGQNMAGSAATGAGHAGTGTGTHSGDLDGGAEAPPPGCGCRTAPNAELAGGAWWQAFAALAGAAFVRRRPRKGAPRVP